MDILKNTSKGAFDGMTTEMLDHWKGYNANSKDKMSEGITDALETLRKSSPEFYNEIRTILKNAPNELKIRLKLTYNINELGDFQKEFQNRLTPYDTSKGKGKSISLFAPQQGQDISDWRTQLQQDNVKDKQLITDLSKGLQDTYNKNTIANTKARMANRTAALKLFGQNEYTDSEYKKEQSAADKASREREKERKKALKPNLKLIVYYIGGIWAQKHFHLKVV